MEGDQRDRRYYPPTRHNNLDELCRSTQFTRKEIQHMYRSFKEGFQNLTVTVGIVERAGFNSQEDIQVVSAALRTLY
ncbi:hypothetical protein CEXT_28831 [Caerostris extrusa]|uniref:4a-hydroxytetrahydrobiopterin dehydratase n=1 Tax=Caerostris extrusa TaxID=172846 RepID=A0AAV4NVE9_CAEEX|nr:hypothetical protein CEXT_28831 [Caerostris extrusa]